ncbi:MAG: DUF4276 family protein [Bacteroidota bacterium]
MRQLFVGLLAEGTTDIRFLSPILEKVLIQTAYDCKGQIDIELVELEVDKTGLSFTEQVLKASKKGMEDFGMMILCVHTDADSPRLDSAYEHKIEPAKTALAEKDELQYCKILVGIVPIQETEAWMLADKALIKREIGTHMSDQVLGIDRAPESIHNPKEVIENAIRQARSQLTKRRRKDLSIAELYLPIGQAIELENLEHLSSFRRFKDELRTAFEMLNLL